MKINPYKILDKYYPEDSECKRILYKHSELVTEKALKHATMHPELKLDIDFISEAAMLHDIGVYLCDSPTIGCFGSEPYIRHGILGAEILRREGLERHALVCERHTGAGLSADYIREMGLPLPERDFIPISLEEKLICFADKFYSKSKLLRERSVEKARKSVLRFSEEGGRRFDEWCALFL